MYLGHEDFKEILKLMADRLCIRSLAIDLHDLTIGTGRSDACDLDATSSVNSMIDQWVFWVEDLDEPVLCRFVALVKGGRYRGGRLGQRRGPNSQAGGEPPSCDIREKEPLGNAHSE